jgi:hypothetical protein
MVVEFLKILSLEKEIVELEWLAGKVQGGAELVLYAFVRDQVLKQSHQLKGLDRQHRGSLCLIQQKDIFQAAHDAQITYRETVSNIQHENAITRREIIQEIRVTSFRSIYHTS